MRIGRAIIIPAILAFGMAGSILAGSAAPVAAGHAPSVQAQKAAHGAAPDIFYHG